MAGCFKEVFQGISGDVSDVPEVCAFFAIHVSSYVKEGALTKASLGVPHWYPLCTSPIGLYSSRKGPYQLQLVFCIRVIFMSCIDIDIGCTVFLHIDTK